MELFATSILFLSALITGLTSIFISARENSKFIQYIVIVGGAYLLGFTITHLIPDIFYPHEGEANLTKSMMFALACFLLLGILLQKGLEYLSLGIEHGHVHLHGLNKIKGFQIMIGLCLHSFLEGGILIHNHAHHSENGGGLLIGIVMHKIPAAFILATVLLESFQSKKWAIWGIFIFAASSPIGFYLADNLFQRLEWSHETFSYFFAMVAGNFIHIAYTILSESDRDHKVNFKKWALIAVGFLAALLVQFI